MSIHSITGKRRNEEELASNRPSKRSKNNDSSSLSSFGSCAYAAIQRVAASATYAANRGINACRRNATPPASATRRAASSSSVLPASRDNPESRNPTRASSSSSSSVAIDPNDDERVLPAAAHTSLHSGPSLSSSAAPSNACNSASSATDETIIRQAIKKDLAQWAGDSENRKKAARIILKNFDDKSSTLDLDFSSLTSLPECIKYLTHLRTLSLANNQLQNIQIPNTLTQLQNLNLSWNQLQTIQIPGTLTQLQELSLIGNSLQTIQIPGTLTQLQELSLSSNSLQTIQIPDTLTQLQSLSVSFNQLQNIQIPNTLTQLQTLHLSGNPFQIIQIPDTLTQLRAIYLFGDLIPNIPISVVRLCANNCRLHSDNAGYASPQIKAFRAAVLNYKRIMMFACGLVDMPPTDCPVTHFARNKIYEPRVLRIINQFLG